MARRSSRSTVWVGVLAALCACDSAVEREIHEGNNAARDGKLVEAQAHYAKAVAADSGSARALALLGNSEQLLKHEDLAAQAWTKALAIDPKNTDAIAGLANAALNRHEVSRALELLLPTHGLSVIPPEIQLVEARALLERNGPEDAVTALAAMSALVKAQPTSIEGWYLQGSAQLALGKYSDAQASFEKLETLSRSSPLWAFGLARLAAVQARSTDALMYLHSAKQTAGRAWAGDRVASDPAFEFVRGSAEFRDLVSAPK